MKVDRKILLLYLVVWLMILNCHGQNINRAVSKDLSKLITEQGVMTSNTTFLIPGLQICIDSALKNSPLIRGQYAFISQQETEYKSKKLDWTNYIQPFAEYKYGSTDYVYIGTGNVGGVITGDVLTTSRYSIGVRLQASLFDVIDRKNQKKIQLYEVDAANAQLEEFEKKIRNDVIIEYYNLVASQRILVIKSDHLEKQRLNSIWADKELRNNNMTIPEYSRIMQMYKEAKEEFELAQKNFNTSYMLLQELAGVDLQTLNDQ